MAPVLIEQLNLQEGRIVVRVPRRHSDRVKEAGLIVLGWIKLSQNFEEKLIPIGLHPFVDIGRRR
jgi:hypothetical protein